MVQGTKTNRMYLEISFTKDLGFVDKINSSLDQLVFKQTEQWFVH